MIVLFALLGITAGALVLTFLLTGIFIVLSNK